MRVQIFGAVQHRAEHRLDREVVRVHVVPDFFVEAAFVFFVAHFSSEEKDEMGLDHRADEALFVLGLRGEGFHAGAPERVAGDEGVVGVVDGFAFFVLVFELAEVVPFVALHGQRRQDFVATVAG